MKTTLTITISCPDDDYGNEVVKMVKFMATPCAGKWEVEIREVAND